VGSFLLKACHLISNSAKGFVTEVTNYFKATLNDTNVSDVQCVVSIETDITKTAIQAKAKWTGQSNA